MIVVSNCERLGPTCRRKGHAHLLCLVPIVPDDLRGVSSCSEVGCQSRSREPTTSERKGRKACPQPWRACRSRCGAQAARKRGPPNRHDATRRIWLRHSEASPGQNRLNFGSDLESGHRQTLEKAGDNRAAYFPATPPLVPARPARAWTSQRQVLVFAFRPNAEVSGSPTPTPWESASAGKRATSPPSGHVAEMFVRKEPEAANPPGSVKSRNRF